MYDKTSFVLFSFLWKFLCGLGAGINSTSSFAIISTQYKKERVKVVGLLESSAGVGLLLGPFVGAILYSIGGYMLPFFVTGILITSIPNSLFIAGAYFLMYPLIAHTLAKIQEKESESPTKKLL